MPGCRYRPTFQTRYVQTRESPDGHRHDGELRGDMKELPSRQALIPLGMCLAGLHMRPAQEHVFQRRGGKRRAELSPQPRPIGVTFLRANEPKPPGMDEDLEKGLAQALLGSTRIGTSRSLLLSLTGV
jgi:hypothetical protein